MEDEILKLDYYIPLVFKNRLSLVHHLTVMKQYMKVFGSCDSFTYVDILPNGKKLSECSREELKDMVDAHTDVYRFFREKTHIENDVYKKIPVLELICPHCGLVTWFDEIDEIPEENFVCQCCDKISIYYSGKNFKELENFNENMKVIKRVIKELAKEQKPDIDIEKIFGD